MITPGDNATVVLTRDRGGWRDRGRSYAVMIDGEQVAKVKHGQRLELPIVVGRHQVFLKIDWCKSPTVEVDAQPGGVIRLSCAPGGTARSGLRDVAGGTQAYISLTRS